MTRTAKIFDCEGGSLLATVTVDDAGKPLDAVALPDGGTWCQMFVNGALVGHGPVEVGDPDDREFARFLEGLASAIDAS